MNKLTNNILDWGRKRVPKGSLLWIVYRYVRNVANINSGFPITIYLYKVHDNIVLHKYKTIYFPIPKVACSSLKKFCADTLNIEIKGKDINEDVHDQHFPCVKKYKINKMYKDYFKFCFVRNPWDRLVSCYMNKIFLDENDIQQTKSRFVSNKINQKKFKLGMSFEEFINAVCSIPDEKADSHIVSQYTYVTDHEDNVLVDFIGKLENFEEDFANIHNKIGVKNVKIPHLMKSSHVDYREYYTEKTKEMVRQRYLKDIKMFGYEF